MWATALIEHLTMYNGHTTRELNAASKLLARQPIDSVEREILCSMIIDNRCGIKLDTLDKQELEEVLEGLYE